MDIFDKNFKYARSIRRNSEAYHMKRRIIIFMHDCDFLFDDNSGNRVEDAKWFEYIGSDLANSFKNYYTATKNPYKKHHRYRKRREYSRNRLYVKEANTYLQYEITYDCKIKVKRKYKVD